MKNKRKKVKISRREFLGGSAAASLAFTIVPSHSIGRNGQTPPSRKITLAGIGTGGQGVQDLLMFQQNPDVQVVAVCDVNRRGDGYLSWNWKSGKDRRESGCEPTRQLIDENYAQQKRSGSYKGCSAYSDYRELLAKEDVDAVMIATPDHNHAVITMAALKKKKHVYCEKPLTHTVYEARKVAEAARQAGVATQMGNQGQASEEARLTCEYIWDGAIGPVREVRAWCRKRFWSPPVGFERPKETPPVPAGLDWNLWLGPAPVRPYHPAYHPWNWRDWWDFGSGQIGDLGAHKLSTVFKALKLGHPTSVQACSTRFSSEVYPHGVIAYFDFPARGDMPPVRLTWYHGGLMPPRPKELEPQRRMSDVTYIGDKGLLMGHRLIPESKMKAYKKPPKTLPRSVGHYKEWIEACKGGPPAGSNFVDHAGLLTEVLLLGNVALRAGKKLNWDASQFKVTNDDGANRYLHREYRKGWDLDG